MALGSQHSILLIEDDHELASLTQDYLQKNNLLVKIESDGGNAVRRIIDEQPDCVLLDIMLPNTDGFTICKEVRKHYNGPIIMLTARDEDIDQLLGLELGADDYITKPVQPRLLLARIHTLLRRIHSHNKAIQHSVLEFDGLTINEGARHVTLNNQVIELSTAEFDLLFLLAKNAGSVLSRDEILQHIRGIGYDGTDRSIDLRISRLRKKLSDEENNEQQRIKTVRSQGYLFANTASSPS